MVLARVHALATAAGCQLVASCDLAVAAESAGFAAPGGKGGWFCHTPMVAIARNVGRKRAMELALTGDVIDAATALDWGLVNRVVPDAELDDAVDDLMARATRGSRASKAWGKQTMYAQLDRPERDAYDDRPRGHGRRQPDPGRPRGHGVLPGEAAARSGPTDMAGREPTAARPVHARLRRAARRRGERAPAVGGGGAAARRRRTTSGAPRCGPTAGRT